MMTDDDDQWKPILSRARMTEQSKQSSDPHSLAISCYKGGPPFAEVSINKSSGIDPSSFYKKSKCSTKTLAEEKLENILKLSSQNEIVQMRREFSLNQKIKQDAYNSVTSFRIFPLQELAMKFLDEMMNEYRGVVSTTEKSIQSQSNKLKSFDGVSDYKRIKKDCSSLNEVREKYVSEFLKEKKFRPPTKQILSECGEKIECLDESRGIKKRSIQHEDYNFLPLMWSMEPRIFAMETSSTGKRKYIVGNLGRFFCHYWKSSDPRARHYYELIREDTPVRLYFDLEFCKVANPQITPDECEALMREFIDELSFEFRSIYNITINRSRVVDLDSSTSKKFSRHLIVHLPNGQLFSNAQCAGIFAKQLVGRLADALSTGSLVTSRPTLSKYLFVNSQAPIARDPKTIDSFNIALGSTDTYRQKSCFVDLGVYTRNRLFRLMGSSKFGKDSSAALRIAATNEFPFKNFSNATFYVPEQVSASVKTTPLSDISLKDRNLHHEKFCAAMNWDAHAEALASTLVVPANASKFDLPVLKVIENKSCETQQPTITSPLPFSHRSKTPLKYSTGVSPIPKLDHFVLSSLGNRGGVQGRIRTWSMDCIKREGRSVTRLMLFQMSGNRWCENIGRPHKSNNIMWTVDLTEKVCWQSCYDPECRITGFRGSPINLPYDVAADIDSYLLDQELAELDEHEIIQKASSNTRATSTDVNFDKP